MTFLDSVNTCLKKTLTISGRASRSEFWWFQLSFFVIGLIVGLIVAALGADSTLASIIGIIWFFPKNGGIHFYHNVQAFNVDSRSTLKA